MELIYEIAEYLKIPNEFITINKIIRDDVWFSTNTGAKYSCTTIFNGKHLKKNSVRYDC